MRLEFEQNLPALSFAERESPEKSAEESHPAVQAMLQNAIESAQEGNRIEARRKLLRVTEVEPRSETAWLWLASISEYPEELLIFLNNVLDINPENERALEWRQTTEALLSKTFVERGINAENANQKSFARQCFFQAAAHDSTNETAWLRLAAISNTTEEKCSHLEKVMNINPKNETARTALREARGEMTHELLRKANSAAFAGDFQAAKTALDEVLQKSPESENAWLLKSFLTESFSDKIYCFEKILEINPRNETAHGNLSSLRVMMKSAVLSANTESSSEKSELRSCVSDSAEIFAPAAFESNAPTQELEFPNALVKENYFSESFADETMTAAEFGDKSAVFGAETFTAQNFADENQPAETSVETFDEDDREIFQIPENASDFPAEKEFVSLEEQKEMLEMDFGAEASDADFAENSEKENFELIVEHADSFMPTTFTKDFYRSPASAESPAEEEQRFDSGAETDFFNAEMSENVFADDAGFNRFNAAESSFLPDASMPDEAEQPVFSAGEITMGNRTAAPENDFDSFRVEKERAESFARNEDDDDFARAATMTSDAEDFEKSEMSTDEVTENQAPMMETDAHDDSSEETNVFSCPFCDAENDVQDFSCEMCGAILSLSDLEMLLGNQNADREIIAQTVNRMEEENSAQSFGEYELMFLGIGHLNLKNLRRGFSYLQQASQTNPNNVLLSSQINALAIRLEEIERKEESSDGQLQNRTILVVDDSPTVRKLISGKLEKSGHEVVCAVDGMDALAKLEQVRPDLILLDITMPRMDGYQVCKMIRNNDALKNIPVVMISGKDGFFDKVRGRMAGTTGYITKPFGPETLMKALDAYIKHDVSAAVMVDA